METYDADLSTCLSLRHLHQNRSSTSSCSHPPSSQSPPVTTLIIYLPASSTTNNKGTQDCTQKVIPSIACMQCFVIVVPIIMIDPKMPTKGIKKKVPKVEGNAKRRTTTRIPTWSPTVVLTRPDHA